jgi:hypothetical protein
MPPSAAMPRIHNCPVCHKSFQANRPQQKYCCFDCSRVPMRKADIEHTCKACGMIFQVPPSSKNARSRVTCSVACTNALTRAAAARAKAGA